MSQPLTNERWEELKELYGDNAYLMIYSQITALCGTNFHDNEMVEIRLHNPDYATLMLKKSAALPFDAKRAANGDKVQWVAFDELVDCTVFSVNVTGMAVIKINDFNSAFSVNVNNLVMKYPPKSTNNKPTTTGEPPC
jgi:hypothetical protein